MTADLTAEPIVTGGYNWSHVNKKAAPHAHFLAQASPAQPRFGLVRNLW